ncbi:MAG: thiolase domain-containing protein [Thermoplasmata archaeon]|nr:thiolase domain-containing protein [Thermoplasmata archaeon]
MRDVAIIGIGMTKFGELWEKSFREIGIEAGLRAIEDAKISGDLLDALYVGNMSAGKLIEQEHVSSLILDYSGYSSKHLPAVRVEAASASGGVALYEAYLAVASGMYDFVMVGGAEKMTDVGDAEANRELCSTADNEWESIFGATYASLFAMLARRHMYEYGTTEEQMAHVAVKNHKFASKNPVAHFKNTLTVEQVLTSSPVATPIKTLDCAPVSDGAAAVVLCPWDHARKFCDTPIKIAGVGLATDTIALHSRRDICTMDAVVRASSKAYHMARIGPKEVNLAEVHDCYTIAEIVEIEDLRLVKKGEGGKATAEGQTDIGGKVVVNPSGGLKGRGQPPGAVGIAQVVEIVQQLRGEAKERQVPGANVGITLNIGGTGATAFVSILKREN